MLKDRAVFPGSQSWEVFRALDLQSSASQHLEGWRERPAVGGRDQDTPRLYPLSRSYLPAEGS